jgi:vitamin B12 transporter
MKKSIRLRARVLVPALSVVAAATGAHAQQLEINPVVISASRLAQPLSEVLPSASVITRQDIEKSQASSLADLIQREVGVEFGRNGGPGSVTSFFLRGQDSTNVVMMVDGVRAQTDGIGSLTLTDFPLAQIERIEILRGNVAALYGEAAVGGVIHIITRQGKGQPNGYGAVSAGSMGTQSVTAGYGGAQGDYSYGLNFSKSRSDGFSSMNPSQSPLVNPDRDGYSVQSVAGKLEKRVTGDVSVGLRFSSTQAENDYDDKALPTDVHLFKKNNDTVGATLRQVMQDWTTSLDLAHASLRYEDLKNGARFSPTSYSSSLLEGSQNTLRWSNTYAWHANHQLSFGVDQIQDTYNTSGNYGYRVQRDTSGVYGGTTSQFDRLTVQFNLRQDQIRLANTANGALTTDVSEPRATSSLLGVGYQLTPEWRLTTTASSGFRAPTAYDISTNVAVSSERYTSQEAGVVYVQPDLFARAVYFQSHTNNAIGFDQNYNAANVGETQNKGVELMTRANWRAHTIKLSAVAQDPWNISTNSALGRRARHYGSLDVSRPWGAYEVGTLLYASGTRKNSDYDSHMLGGYAVWSFYVSRPIDTEWTARVKLDNAFDRQYQLAYGYNTPGRSVLATLQYRPK